MPRVTNKGMATLVRIALTLAVVSGAVVIFEAPASAAALCLSNGQAGAPTCNGKYYDTQGCGADSYQVADPLYGTLGSDTQWWLEVRYSGDCGAAWGYVHNFHEKGNDPLYFWDCYAQIWKSTDLGATWSLKYEEPVESPTYNFAYTKMVGDWLNNERARARVHCVRTRDALPLQISHLYSAFVTEP